MCAWRVDWSGPASGSVGVRVCVVKTVLCTGNCWSLHNGSSEVIGQIYTILKAVRLSDILLHHWHTHANMHRPGQTCMT